MESVPKNNPAFFAREVIWAALEYKPLPEPPDEEYFLQRAACFVSLKKNGQLRGCIGTLEPVEASLGEEIVRNAQSSAFADPRFPAVLPEELPEIEVSVDVLGEPEVVEDIRGQDCKKYGVIVSCDYRRGVLLPDLEGVDTVEEQLLIACRKADISPNEKFKIERFMVSRFHED